MRISNRRISMTAKPVVSQLGMPTPIPADPASALLERVPNPHADTDCLARFACPEFTSLCPVTGQPDFGHLVIDYVPDKCRMSSGLPPRERYHPAASSGATNRENGWPRLPPDGLRVERHIPYIDRWRTGAGSQTLSTGHTFVQSASLGPMAPVRC